MIALSPPHVEYSEVNMDSLDESMSEMQMKNNTRANEQDISMDDSSGFLNEIINKNCGKYFCNNFQWNGRIFNN